MKNYLPVLAFCFLLIYILYPFDFATSVVPGWHAVIYPPGFIWSVISMILIVFVVIGYWLLAKTANGINWLLFGAHFSVTVLAVVFIKFPLLWHGNKSIDEYSMQLEQIKMPVYWVLAGSQTLFLVYYFRVVKKCFEGKKPKAGTMAAYKGILSAAEAEEL